MIVLFTQMRLKDIGSAQKGNGEYTVFVGKQEKDTIVIQKA